MPYYEKVSHSLPGITYYIHVPFLSARPEPRSCEDIGTWYSILEIISTVAVLTNSALVAFTAQNAVNQTWPVRVWVFMVMSAGVLIIKKVIADYVPDVPKEVTVQLKRNEYYVDKILHNIPDEEDSPADVRPENVDYHIKINDDDPL